MPPCPSLRWFLLPAASLISGAAAARANGTAIVEGAASASADSVPGRAFGTTAEPFLRHGMPIPHSALSKAAVKNGTIFDVIGEPAVRTHFDTFKATFGRNYGTKEEEAMRFQSFEASVRTVNELNRRNGASVFGINHLSDLFEDELAAIAPTGLILRNPDQMEHRLALAPRLGVAVDVQQPSEKAPSSALTRAIDWRLAGAVTPVKTQGACGDCWAFSVVEEVESMYSIYADDSFQTFPPQQVTSCATESYGCGGGDPIDGYAYIVASPGLAQEVFWPFSGGLTPAEACSSKSCTQACNAKDLTLISRHRTLIGAYAIVKNAFFAIPPCGDPFCEKQDLQELARALVNEGPVSVIVNAEVWPAYKSGVMTYAACGNISMSSMNHAVQLVGFNTTGKMPFWIVRNSWSTLWGNHGYIHLEFGKNTCGVGNLATFAEVVAGGWDVVEPANKWHPRRLQESRENRFERLYKKATQQV